MATAKQKVEELLRTLPDDCTLEDIQYHLYVLENIQQGLESLETEPTYTQEEIEAEFGYGLPNHLVEQSEAAAKGH